jgi:predicted aldo/keto reductase-like oxidoreductase
MSSRRQFLRFSSAAIAALTLPVLAKDGMLPTRPIPGTDERLPIVGLGNSEVFRAGDLDRTRQLLELLLGRGGAYVDVSGPSRFTVAQVVDQMKARDRTLLGTYFEVPDNQVARQEIEAVSKAQGGGGLDLVLTRDIQDFSARRDDFRRLKDDGLTRYVGVARHQSRYHPPMMALMSAGAVDFVQVNYSMLEPEADQRLLPMARDKGIAVIVNRPFINGQYFYIVRGHTLPEWAAEFDCVSWAQFSLKFILSHPAVNCAITETANPKHAVDNIGGGIGRLPDAKTRRRMLELVRGLA